MKGRVGAKVRVRVRVRVRFNVDIEVIGSAEDTCNVS